jgi:hypothetical protein
MPRRPNRATRYSQNWSIKSDGMPHKRAITMYTMAHMIIISGTPMNIFSASIIFPDEYIQCFDHLSSSFLRDGVKRIVDAKAPFRSLAEAWADTGTSTGRLMIAVWADWPTWSPVLSAPAPPIRLPFPPPLAAAIYRHQQNR